MRALGTAQHHLTSNLDECRTASERDEHGSQAVTYSSFPRACVQHYTKHGAQTHCPNTNGFSTVYFWNHVLRHITVNGYSASGCRSFRVLENGNRCRSRGGVVLYDPSYSDSYSDSYLDFPHSKLSVHGQRGLKPTPGLLRDYLYLIRSVTCIFIDTVTNRELRIHRHSVNPERKRGATNDPGCTVLYCTRIVRDLCALLMEW
jgi:hypothetical protein